MATEPTEQELLHEGVRETDNEILQEAFADEPPPAEEPEGEEPEAPAEGDGPLRNERGQFTARTPAREPGEQQPEGEQPEGQERGENDVPRWRLREIAEARRSAEAERETLRAELIRTQTWLHQFEQGQQRGQQQQPQQQPQAPDPLIDPTGYAQSIQGNIGSQMREMQLNFDLQLTHMRHGEVFEKAYEALLGTGPRDGGATIRQLVAANPTGAGQRIVDWYRQGELMRETKGDLAGFKAKLESELLANPEFLKKAMDAARQHANGGTAPNGGGRAPNTITRFPPSLARQTGNAPVIEDDGDDSDRAAFDYAFRNN
jgi:hypothetical protein